MMLSIRHVTRYAYEPAAASAALRLKLTPPGTSAQALVCWEVTVNGQPVSPLLTDALGNNVALWHAHAETGGIEIVASGEISTSDTAGVLGGISQAARPGMFLRTGELTTADEAIVELAGDVSGEDRLARLHALSERIHAAVDYRPGATTAETTAAEVAALGVGVCQDHAHVFIAACRSAEIPARYVAGYLFDPDDELNVGDQTHAWAEAFVPGLGWVGFDVTNQLCPTDAYVRLTCGLDASDAAPVRGVLSGQPEEELEVDVAVQQAQSQTQS